MNQTGRDGPGTIVVGIDGSTSSLRAAAYAVGLARRQRSRLVAVYVRSLPTTVPSLAVAHVIDAQDAIEHQLRDAIREVDGQLVVRTGEPFRELCTVAREAAADAVVVGRSANALHRIAGSVAVRLVRCGRWPVTVVP